MFKMESQTRFWLLILALVATLIWVLKPVLLPFLAGMAIAYFLNPVVDALAKRKIPRWIGAVGVLLGFGLIMGAILTLLLPLLESQIGALIQAIPGVIQKLRADYMPGIENWLMGFTPSGVEKLRNAAGQSVGEAAGWIGGLLRSIITGGFALFDILALTIVTPVVAFFMMRDWPQLVASIDSLFPRRYYDVIHAQLEEIDRTLAGFVRGQALVCMVMSIYYGTALTVAGLNYGVAIGITAGVLTFIPFVGTGFGWISSLILSFVQFNGDPASVAKVIGVFALGHVMEAYFLAPRLVGNRVGLHPVWILFALITGVRLMGFTGILIALPTAAILGVLTRFMLRQYKASAVYKDTL